jgi:hypothetical protein
VYYFDDILKMKIMKKNKNNKLSGFCLVYLLYIPIAIIMTLNNIAALALLYIIPLTLLFSFLVYLISNIKKAKFVDIIYFSLMLILIIYLVSTLYSELNYMLLMLLIISITSFASMKIVVVVKKKGAIISFWGLNFNLFLIIFLLIASIIN